MITALQNIGSTHTVVLFLAYAKDGTVSVSTVLKPIDEKTDKEHTFAMSGPVAEVEAASAATIEEAIGKIHAFKSSMAELDSQLDAQKKEKAAGLKSSTKKDKDKPKDKTKPGATDDEGEDKNGDEDGDDEPEAAPAAGGKSDKPVVRRLNRQPSKPIINVTPAAANLTPAMPPPAAPDVTETPATEPPKKDDSQTAAPVLDLGI